MQEYCIKIQETYVLEICSNKYLKHMFYKEIRIKQGLFLYIILCIKDSLQQQIYYNGNIFRNKCCRCNEGSLYMNVAAILVM